MDRVGAGRRFPQISYLGLGLVLLVWACPKSSPDRGPDSGLAEAPPQIRVDGARTDLVFTYFDEKSSAFRSVTRIADVPLDKRRSVVVVDLSLSPEERGAGTYVSLADLSARRPDGTYPVAIASRFGFEAQALGTSTATASESASGQIVLYSASWCGACKKARRFLDGLGVRYQEKDIE